MSESKNSTVDNPSGNVVDNLYSWSETGVTTCLNCGHLDSDFSQKLSQQLMDLENGLISLFGNLSASFNTMFSN